MNVAKERNAFDQLHGEKPVQAVADQLIESNEISVVQPGKAAEFLFEMQERAGVDPLHGFERYHTLALAIEGLIDNAHAAAAKLANNVITGEIGRGRDVGNR